MQPRLPMQQHFPIAPRYCSETGYPAPGLLCSPVQATVLQEILTGPYSSPRRMPGQLEGSTNGTIQYNVHRTPIATTERCSEINGLT